MSLIRRAAFDALADALRTVLEPDLHQVLVNDADPDDDACWPHLVVRQTGSLTFKHFLGGVSELGTTEFTETVEVGVLSGRCELKLGAKTQEEREILEDRILDLFLSQDDKPGTLVLQLEDLTISGVTYAGSIPVAFALDSDAWQEEMVFDRKRFSSIELLFDLSAAVTRDARDIKTLVLAMTEDLESDVPTDQVSVLEDDPDETDATPITTYP